MRNIKKIIYLLIGIICFLLGIIGIFIPLLPTTPLLILTSICFLKSSERLNEKFTNTKLYERYVKSFKEKGGMSLKSKLYLVIPVSILLLFMFIIIDNSIIRLVILTIWITKVIVFIKIKTIQDNN